MIRLDGMGAINTEWFHNKVGLRGVVLDVTVSQTVEWSELPVGCGSAKERLADGSGRGRRVYLQRSSSKTTADDIREDNHQRSKAKHPLCIKWWSLKWKYIQRIVKLAIGQRAEPSLLMKSDAWWEPDTWWKSGCLVVKNRMLGDGPEGGYR